MARNQVIVVMGVTGVGKSTFIQHATGKEVKIGHSQEACESLLTVSEYWRTLTGGTGTAEVKMYQIPDTTVYLMDTPGFDDTYLSDADILKNIATALVDAFNDQVEIQGALYIHQVTEARMRGVGKEESHHVPKCSGSEGHGSLPVGDDEMVTASTERVRSQRT